MTEPDSRFADRAIRRRPLFLALSRIGIAVALPWRLRLPEIRGSHFPIGVRVALVTLILLNARQNLRQYKFATLLMAARGEKSSA